MTTHPGYPAGRIASVLGLAKRSLELTRLTDRLVSAQRWMYPGGYVRAINYHATPTRFQENFRNHLAFFQRRFAPVTHEDLVRFFEDGRWGKAKPGLIISFDDGLRSNYSVAAPLLEEFGFTGWFFPPTDFINCPVEQQADFARDHQVDVDPEAPRGERIAMTWEELRTLAQRHVIGCHTQSHRRLGDGCTDEQLDAEIVEGKAVLEAGLGRTTDVFCWVGGEESSYSARAAERIRSAGYRFSFMTNSAPIRPGTDPLQLQRINVDASWTTDWAAFQVCGLLDVLYTGKRRRVVGATGA